MSNTFYKYLCDKIIDYFNNTKLEPSKKYNLSFDSEDKVIKMYEEFQNCNNVKAFEFQNYKTIEIKFGEVQLLIGATVNGVTVDYLTKLRNLISENNINFKNKSILFIHSSTLDSLIGGSESLVKAGLPLNINEIKKDIKNKIKKFDSFDKGIIESTIDSFDNSSSSTLALFEYEHILKVINNGKIEQNEYDDFDLFQDPANVGIISQKEIINRIKDNNELYKEIKNIEKYGDIENDLIDKYDNSIIDKIKNRENITYQELKKSIEKKINQNILTYDDEDGKKISEENIIYWEIADGHTKLKKRKRNFLIFNYENKSEIKIVLHFKERVLNSYINMNKSKILDISLSGKNVNVTLIPTKERNYDSFKINSGKIEYEFKFLIVDLKENVLKNIAGKWTLKKDTINITSLENKITFNEDIHGNPILYYVKFDEKIDIPYIDTERIEINFEDSENNLYFNMNTSEYILKFIYILEKNVLKELKGKDLWLLKNKQRSNFELPKDGFINNNKVIFSGNEYYTKSELNQFLVLEEEIIKTKGLYYKYNYNKLIPIELPLLPENIKKIYEEILSYFEKNNTSPSLAYIDEELKTLYSEYVDMFLDIFNNIDYNNKDLLSTLMNIGKIWYSDTEIWLTPLHPLNILYQLEIFAQLDNFISQNIVKHLNSLNLLPYIAYEDKVFIVEDQINSMEWKKYNLQSVDEYISEKKYIKKLFVDKTLEFLKYFHYLFELNNKSPLIINLINLGNCNEILNGVFNFLDEQLKTKEEAQVVPLILNIYSKDDVLTKFEELDIYKTMDEILDNLEIDILHKSPVSNELLDLYREKISFYKKNILEIDYAHLTFYEMDKEILQKSYDSMKILDTGISLNGFNSTLTPSYIGDVYKNGFGIKGANNSELLKLAKIYNSVSRVADNEDPYDPESTVVINLSKNRVRAMDSIYDNSHWITFIDPKVDINFFKGQNENLIIIHYSDQYSINSGYDAITVTKKTKIYEEILIREFKNICNQNIQVSNLFKDYDLNSISRNLISQFNSINGDWLLRFSRNNNKELLREKISILSSVKFGLMFFNSLDSNIIWVPISLEEILRVTGSAGLSQKDGIFSKKNLGITGECSDDLLFVGIDKNSQNIKLYLYPVEVKIGENNNNVIEKAINQSSALIEKLNEIFIANTFENRFYRNFLIQILYNNIEKFIVYNFGEIEKYKELLDSSVKEKLWNEDYEYSNDLANIIGKFGIFSFKKNGFSRSIEIKDDLSDGYLLAEFTENDGYSFVNFNDQQIINILNQDPYLNLIKKVIEINNTFKSELSEIKDSNIEVSINDLEIEQEINIETKDTFFDFSEEIVEKFKEIKNEDKSLQKEAINSIENIIDNSKEEVHSLIENIDEKNNQGMKITFGKDSYGYDYVWEPNNTDILMHPNTGIIGTMGTGKTQFTKSLITQLYRERKQNIGTENLGILIFDYKGDYIKEDFVKETNAQILEPYNLSYNPLSIFNSKNSKPLLPLHTASAMKETLVKGFGLGTVQESTLLDLLLNTYESVGISRTDRSTWNNPAPTFKDVYDYYMETGDIKKDSLYSSLNTIVEYQLFESDRTKVQNLYELLNGVVIIKLNGYDEGLQNLIVAMTLDLFYSQMQISGHSTIQKNLREISKVILVDEADNFLSKNFSSIRKILKEGREFGVGTILSTQFLDHFVTSENDYTNYLETWVIHKVAKISNKEVKTILGLKNGKNEEDSYISQIQELEKHYSFVKSGSKQIMKINDLAFWKLLQK